MKENVFVTIINANSSISIDEILQYKNYYNEFPSEFNITIELPDWFIEYINPKNIYTLPTKSILIKEQELQFFSNSYYFLSKLAIGALLKKENYISLIPQEQTDLKKCIENDINIQNQALLNLKQNIEHFNKKIYDYICQKILICEPQPLENYKNFLKLLEKDPNINLIKHLYWFISECSSFSLLKNIIDENYGVEHFIKEYCNFLKREFSCDYFFINYQNNWDGECFDIDSFPNKVNLAIKNIKNRQKAKTFLCSAYSCFGFKRKQNENYKRKGIVLKINNLFNYKNDIYFVYKLKIEKF